MLINFILSNFLFTYFVFCSGNIFAKLFKINYDEKYILLFGIIFLSISALFLNFFVPLNKFNNTVFLILIFMLSYYNFGLTILKKNFSIIFLISLINILLILGSNHYRPDAFIYHLPYVATLNENKIILGLVNLNYRFGHTSITQYFSALSNNYIFGNNGISLYLPIIFSSSLYFFLTEIKKGEGILKFLAILIFLTFLVKTYRVNEYGNDYYGHFFYLITFYLFIETICKKNVYFNKFFIICLFSLFIFFNKISLGVCIIFIIIILIKFKKYHYIFKVKFSILILFFLIFLLKNIMISGCAIYPVAKTCLNNLSWTPKFNNYGYSKQISIDTQAWSKSWPDYFKKKDNKQKKLNQEEFIKNLNWFSSWYESQFKILSKKLLPLFIVFFLVIVTCKNIRLFKFPNINKDNFLVFSSCLICLLVWFFKFPLYRFGFSIIIAFILSILMFLNIEKNETKKNNVLKLIILICIIFFITQNVKKIYYNPKNLIPIITYDNFKTYRNEEFIVQNLSDTNNCGFIAKCSNKKFEGDIKIKNTYEIYFPN